MGWRDGAPRCSAFRAGTRHSHASATAEERRICSASTPPRSRHRTGLGTEAVRCDATRPGHTPHPSACSPAIPLNDTRRIRIRRHLISPRYRSCGRLRWRTDHRPRAYLLPTESPGPFLGLAPHLHPAAQAVVARSSGRASGSASCSMSGGLGGNASVVVCNSQPNKRAEPLCS